jgi:hypothetical protein
MFENGTHAIGSQQDRRPHTNTTIHALSIEIALLYFRSRDALSDDRQTAGGIKYLSKQRHNDH